MSALAVYFTARSVPAYAGRLRFIQSRLNGQQPGSSFRTWTAAKQIPRVWNLKAVTGTSAVLAMAGVAMYPEGRHSLYPGIPIPVTSLERRKENKDSTDTGNLLVVENLDKSEIIHEQIPAEKDVEPHIRLESIESEKTLTPSEDISIDKEVVNDENKAVDEGKETPTEIKSIPLQPNIAGKEEEKDVAKEVPAALQKKRDIPAHVPYLLVGAGTATFAAYRAIKSKDPTAKILIVGEENRLPYMRPPLSKELWYPPLKEVTGEDGEGNKITKMAPTSISSDDSELRFSQWNGKERSLYYEPEQFYTPVSMLEDREKGGISVLRGNKVDKIDPENQVAYLEDGTKISYDKCLIATGR